MAQPVFSTWFQQVLEDIVCLDAFLRENTWDYSFPLEIVSYICMHMSLMLSKYNEEMDKCIFFHICCDSLCLPPVD